MRRPRAEGFTLVEVMIALVLMALAAAVLFGSLRLAARSWDAGEAKLEESAQARLAQQFLRTHLSQQYPLRLRKEQGVPLFFEGARDSLRFASFLPDRVLSGGIFLMRLAVIERDGRKDFVVLRRIPDAAITRDTGFDDAEVSVLEADVAAIRFGYFGTEADEGEPHWLDRWSDPQRLPKLIRIEVEPKHGVPWPTLVVEPRISLEVGCSVWNTATKRCVG